MSQDGNQRANNPNQYIIHDYDEFNRLIYSAEFISSYSYPDLEYHINNGYVNNIYREVSETNIFLENSWDNLPDWFNSSWDYNAEPGFENSDDYPESDSSNFKGLLVASRERTLQPNGNFGSWLRTKYFYDEKGRLIQRQQNTGGSSKMTESMLLSWNGELLESIEEHNYVRAVRGTVSINTTNRIHKEYQYDHSGRLIETNYKLIPHEGDVLEYVSELEYDPLGRINKEKIDNSIIFTNQYNIRNWITQMSAFDSDSDFFELELKYENDAETLQFAGNISDAFTNTMPMAT